MLRSSTWTGWSTRGSGFVDRAAEAAAGFLAHGLNLFRRVHDAAQLDFLEALVAARGALELREEGRVANVVGGFLFDLFRPQDAANGGGPLLRRENRPACDAYGAVEACRARGSIHSRASSHSLIVVIDVGFLTLLMARSFPAGACWVSRFRISPSTWKTADAFSGKPTPPLAGG